MKALGILSVSVFLAFLVFGFLGCTSVDETIVSLKVTGPTSVTVTDKLALTTYTATGFNGEIWNANGKSYTSSVEGPYFWYVIADKGNNNYAVVFQAVGGPIFSVNFSVAGSYVVFVSTGASFKSGKVTNAELASRAKLAVTVSKGQGYKETTITPRMVIDEWYPGYILVDTSRSTVDPITDEITGWSLSIDGKKFSSQQRAGVSVSEGNHIIRIELNTLYGFSHYLETNYTYKSGAASVEIKGSTGGSATGGTSGTIDNPPYNPPVDDNPVIIPKPVEGRDGNFDASFNKGQEMQVNKNETVRVPVYGQGLCDKVNIAGIYFDPALLTLQAIESAGPWEVSQKSGANFSATNSSPDAGAVVICYLVFKVGNNVGISGLTWPSGMSGSSAGYLGRGLFLRGIDGSVRVK
ncbi:MAG: hypothetical protein Q7R99_02320 [bacterium]|nr:hypothetical protein [bacterium]